MPTRVPSRSTKTPQHPPRPARLPPWQSPPRPPHVAETPPQPIPEIDPKLLDDPSTKLSQHRTKLSTHRTGLSEHRTQLSEHRTDLSTHRTDLSEHRTDLSEHRTDLSEDRTEMSMRRTGMSFQRTRLSAERTLMSVMRTSLSLISFGFTIYQVFQKMGDHQLFAGSAPARNFGVLLVVLGIAMLVIGIVYHLMFMTGLRNVRDEMTADGLIHGQSGFPPSMTLIAAVLLLLVGVAAIGSMVFQLNLFG
jgi:uncharacterized membrane protein YidH (DUF202 family)